MLPPDYIETHTVANGNVIREEFESVQFECKCGWEITVREGEEIPFNILSHGIFLARCPSCSQVATAGSDDLDHRWKEKALYKDVIPTSSPTISFGTSVVYDKLIGLHGSDAALAICSEGHLTCVGSYEKAVIRKKTGEYGPFRTLDETISLDETLVESGHEPGYLRCVECEVPRQITCDGVSDNEEGHHVISLHSGRTTPYRVNGTARGKRMCPTCGNYHISKYSDKHEGPDAPDIGWEYYKCEICENKCHPDSILDVEDPHLHR